MTKLLEKYELMEVLGSGAFGTVRKCKNRKTGQLAACKTIDKAQVDNVETLQREIDLLKEVNHPHIIRLYDIFDDIFELHLVTELCTGGELYDKVIEKAESPEGHFSEQDAGLLIRDILDAIRYIHDELNIVHRDLKPENFLLSDKNEELADVKIIDFGLSRKNDSPFGLMTTRVGTPYYVAPEVLAGDYTIKCDVWSIGVITYILLCGFCPFAGEDDIQTMNLVQTAPLEFPSPEWDLISAEAKDFVESLLQREAFMRPTAAQALEHPWMAQFQVAETADAPDIPRPKPFCNSNTPSLPDKSIGSLELRLNSTRRTAFQKFLGDLKLKKVLNGTVQNVLSPLEARHLGDVFKRVDLDKDSKITAEDIDKAAQSSKFSVSVREHLKEMGSLLKKRPHFSLDIRPFINAMDRRAQSE